MRGYFEKYDLANMANMSNMANTRQSLNKNSNDMAKPFANGDFDKNGEFGENVEYSESSSRHPLKSGNFGEYGENDEFDVARAPLIVVILTKMANLAKLDCKTVGFFLKISKAIGNAWRKSLTRARRASLSPQSHSLFSASFQIFCLTARAYLNTQKYGLFCSLFCHRFGEYSNWVAEGVPWIVDFVENGESGENTENAKVSQGSFAEH